MGGYGSGSGWRVDARSTTVQLRSIDVRRWAREGMLRPGYAGGWQWSLNGKVMASIQMRAEVCRVVLTYRHQSRGSDWTDVEYPVKIARTPCRYGGSRPWFTCPARGCERRVAILYGGAIFACRRCHRLAYASSRESFDDRIIRRADNIRACLSWEPGILNGTGDKPKWMRWRTFERLTSKHNQLIQRSLRTIALKYNLLSRRSDECHKHTE